MTGLQGGCWSGHLELSLSSHQRALMRLGRLLMDGGAELYWSIVFTSSADGHRPHRRDDCLINPVGRLECCNPETE